MAKLETERFTMKISDPIGKVYQHSMFKKKSYNVPTGSEYQIIIYLL